MQADIHAAVFLALLFAAGLSLAVLKRRVPSSRQLLPGLFLAGFGTLAAPLLNHHMCYEGEPRTQWLILGPCLLLVLFFVQSPAWRRTLGATLLLGMVGLSCHFTELVHEPGWTGNPDWDGGATARLNSTRYAAAKAAAETEDPNADVPAGWLRDLPLWSTAQDQLQPPRPYTRGLHRTWHTWLTGLYRCYVVPQDFWHPGGPLSDGLARLELRDRPAP